jgi:hypothetical protein
MTVYVLVSEAPDREPDFALTAFTDCVKAGRWIVGVTNWGSRLAGREEVWADTILLGEDRFEIRPRVRVSPGATVWFDLDGWAGTPYERKWPVPDINPAAFTEAVLRNPLDWMRDTERQDMRRILGLPDDGPVPPRPLAYWP